MSNGHLAGDLSAALAYIRRNHTNEGYFANALTLHALSTCPQASQLRPILAHFLQGALRPSWMHDANLGELLTVLNVLHAYDANIVTGAHIATVVERLIAAEDGPGGPYREHARHLDTYVNQQVQQFAAWAAGPLPRVMAFLEHQRQPQSDYATWLCQQVPSPALGFQRADGSWLPQPIRTQPVRVASSLVSTARAIARLGTAATMASSASEAHTERIITRTSHELSMTFDGIHGYTARKMLGHIVRANHAHEISLVSHYFAEALGKKLSADELILLGQANVYCWLGYMLYDKIVDTQSHTAYMPIVTVAIRRSTALYRTYLPSAYIDQTFDAMDTANIWELQHARFEVNDDTITVERIPQYGNRGQLARRSGGHTLGPLLVAQRYQPDQLHEIKNSLHHYLIARQLHDDAHDWHDDLAAGHISYVVARLLRGAGITPGPYALSALSTDLRALFWRQTALEICDRIDMHLTLARKYFDVRSHPKDHSFMALITRLEQASLQTRREQRRGAQFIYHFQQLKSPT